MLNFYLQKFELKELNILLVILTIICQNNIKLLSFLILYFFNS